MARKGALIPRTSSILIPANPVQQVVFNNCMLGTFEKIAYISMILLIEGEQFKQTFIYSMYSIV